VSSAKPDQPCSGSDTIVASIRVPDDALLTVKSANRVIELFGPLPRGDYGQEVFAFGGPGSHHTGRLRMDSLAAIYLVSTDSGDNEIHQVAIFDKNDPAPPGAREHMPQAASRIAA